MKKIFHKPILIFSILMSLLMGGCYSELSNLELGNLKWSPELGIPLVDSKFTLIEILEANSSTIDYTTNANNTVVISISDDSIFSQYATDFYGLSDQTLNVPPILLTPEEIQTFNTNGEVTVVREEMVDYPNEGDLDRIVIAQGNVQTQVEEDFPADLDLSFSIEDPNNAPIIDYNHFFGYNGDDPIRTDQSTDQFNDIGFNFITQQSMRQVKFSFSIFLEKVGGQDLVFGENSINLNVEFRDLEFEGLYGDLSSQTISTNEHTITTDIFDVGGILDDIEYFFADPQLRLKFTNSMGVPIRFDVNDFITYKDGQSANEPINSTVALEASNEGTSTVSEADFDSKFKSVINNTPDSVSLQIDGVIDPDDSPNNFVTSESYFQAGYEVNLPLEFSLSGLEINQTVSLDGIDPQELQYALFKFTSENSLPIDLNFKADLLSADSTVIMNLFDGRFLAGGTESEPESISDIIRLEDNPDTGRNELDDLNDVRRVGITASVATSNGNVPVRITADAFVQFNLAIQAKYNVNLQGE